MNTNSILDTIMLIIDPINQVALRMLLEHFVGWLHLSLCYVLLCVHDLLLYIVLFRKLIIIVCFCFSVNSSTSTTCMSFGTYF